MALDDLQRQAGFGSTQKETPADEYVESLEKVRIVVDGKPRTLVGGQFRDVPFFVEEHEFGTGRRILSHEMPLVDDPFNEDMGRKVRMVTIVGYLLGSDVLAQRDALMEACEAEGVGNLVHPYFGVFVVRCSEFASKDKALEKRITRINMSFVLEPQNITPRVQADQTQGLKNAADAADQSNIDTFSEAFTVADAANFVVDSALDATNSALDAVFAAKESVRSVAVFIDKITRVRAQLDVLVQAPESLANQIVGLVNFTDPDADTASLAQTRIDEAMEMAKFTVALPPGGATPQREQENANLLAIGDLVAQAGGTDAGRNVADTTFESFQDAERYVDILDEMYDGLQDVATNDDNFDSSRDMQAKALTFIRDGSGDLARAVTITPSRTVPALVLAYELTGSTESADDIISRNQIKNPSFIPGALPIEILQDS